MIDLQFWPYEVRMSFSQYIKELAEISDDFDNDQISNLDLMMPEYLFFSR